MDAHFLLLDPVTGRVGDPHWNNPWLIADFFLGGIAAGAFIIAAMAQLFGGPRYRDVARLGFILATPLLAICGLTLIMDLSNPPRFWHMLWNVSTSAPAFKYWSPMSYGSWILVGFSLFSGLATALVLAERFLGGALARLREGLVGHIVAALGALFALNYGTYTGALLNSANQRVWGDNLLFGALFITSGTFCGLATLLLALSLRRERDGAVLDGLRRATLLALVVKLVLIAALVASLANIGAAGDLIGGIAGIGLWAGVVLLGLLVPLGLYLRPRLLGVATPALAGLLALVGGAIFRWVILLSAHV